MYDLPSMKNVTKVVVDESVVTGSTQPYLIFSGEKQLAASD
jgi:ATP-dependent Clp protease ATP-binding subunit ClpX